MTAKKEEKIQVIFSLRQSLNKVRTKKLLPERLEKALNVVEIIFNRDSPQVLKLKTLIEAIDYSKLEDFISISDTGKKTNIRIDGWDRYRRSITDALDMMILELEFKEDTATKPPKTPLTTASIFISYRRLDSAAYAGRISDHLEMRLGSHPVFFDVNSIKPGTNFKKEIEKAVTSCQVLLAVIGKQWLTITDDQGNRRLVPHH